MSIKAYKGFNADMTCRGFKYEEGEEYSTDRAEICEAGFHACENPIDCLQYYPPCSSVYREVDLDGETDRGDGDDTKISATKIRIGARLDIAGLVKAAIDFVMSKVKPGATADEDYGLASERGYNSACSATGYKSACSATGDNSACSATGDNSACSATGDNSACSAENPTAIAVAWGVDSKAKGVKGAHIVISEWRWDCHERKYAFFASRMIRIDGEKYKADTWYTLRDGKIVEVKEARDE